MNDKKEMREETQSPWAAFLKWGKGFWAKRKWQIGIALGVILFLLFLKAAKHESHDSKHLESSKKEERVTYQEKDLRQTLKFEIPKLESKKPFEMNRRGKRNYATDIAAFLFKESKDSKEKSENTRKKKMGLPSGSKIPAYVSGTLFSFNVEAPVVAVVTKDILRNGEIIIPKESQFLGEAGVLKSLNRINVRFDLLILPDGKEVKVKALGLSDDGSAGIKGRVNKHRDLRILKVIGESGLALASLFTGTPNSDAFSLEDQVRVNLSQGLTQDARQQLKSVKVDTSITVDGFTPIQVILLDSI